ncbi:MAG TPA: AraC family transcriptional regulator [Clostridiales bacterium]|nr:AraC family transcriptional regulator [Clostridiales bacterium]
MSEIEQNSYIEWPAEPGDLIKVMCWSGDQPVQTHKHKFIEIAFIAHGSCTHNYLASDVKLIPGDVFIITPHEEHSYKIEAKTIIYNCLFYPHALGEDWNKLKDMRGIHDLLIVEPFYRLETKQQEILHLEPADATYIEDLFKKMLEEQEEQKLGFEIIHKCNLSILLCLLGRIWVKQMSGSAALYKGKRTLLAEALQYIENNLDSSLKIEDLALKAYLSPSYFCILFKKTLGLTPIEYINKIRISKACRLLEKEELTISQIAEAVGINDLNYFSRLFKLLAGCTPSEYRKKKRLY